MTYDLLVKRARTNRLAALSATSPARRRTAAQTSAIVNIFVDLA